MWSIEWSRQIGDSWFVPAFTRPPPSSSLCTANRLLRTKNALLIGISYHEWEARQQLHRHIDSQRQGVPQR
jgi:hypothetical protein